MNWLFRLLGWASTTPTVWLWPRPVIKRLEGSWRVTNYPPGDVYYHLSLEVRGHFVKAQHYCARLNYLGTAPTAARE